ncbi:MAG TPA: type II toxin-antitoxin system VapC family toxin [Nitrospiraceae bacterium]|nr:type II toxin-antitoxin system VapC family toxin [Nitrospiraceae bacterium]
MTIVPDASVLLKLVLQEASDPDHDDAIRFIREYQKERFDVVLPTLWRYEIGNVLGLKASATAKESMEVLLAFHFPEALFDHDYCMMVLDFMREINGITFYDAAYHVLALRTGGTLLTADSRYVKKASGKRHVTLLSDWSV